MVESNTDRLWFTVGAIIVGAVIIYIFRDQVGGIITKLINKFNTSIDTAFTHAETGPAAGALLPF